MPTGIPGGHLHRGKQRIHALERRALHRHAQHRQQRVRGADSRQVRRAAGRRDDHFDPAAFGAAHILGRLFRRAVRRKHAAFVLHAEFRQHLVGLAHDIPVRLAAHDHSNQRMGAHGYCPCARVNPAFPSKLRSVSVTAMSMPASAIRRATSSSLPISVAPCATKRQRKLSVQKVSARARRPYFDAAIVDHLQAQAVARQFADRLRQRVGIARGPVDEHVDALQLHRDGRPLRLRRGRRRRRTMRIRHRLQDIRLLAQPLDHRRGEFLRPHFRRADALGEDVVGVDAVFDRAQPGVVHLGRDLRLVDVHQHQHRAQQQPEGFARFCPARRGADP